MSSEADVVDAKKLSAQMFDGALAAVEQLETSIQQLATRMTQSEADLFCLMSSGR
jgi:hypothetical protein